MLLSLMKKELYLISMVIDSYRLIVDIEYRLKIVFIVWFGSYNQYDKVNTKTISYVKTN